MSTASFFSIPKHISAFGELIKLLVENRHLTLEMTRREIGEKYAGQVLGTFWAIGHPLMQMAVYVFIFAVVFKVKVGGTLELPLDYTTYLLCGLIPWMTMQESLNKGTTAIVAHSSLVKQAVFPLEILPIKGVLVSFVTQLVASMALTLYVLISHGTLHLTYLLVPVLFFFQLLTMAGLCLALSVVGAFLRDIKDFIQVFCLVGMYLMPVFYLPSMVPGLFRPILYANPFSYMIWCYQDVFYFGRFEHPFAWVVFPILSLLIFTMGYRTFRKLKPMLGNVL